MANGSDWGESNRLHSSNVREEAAYAALSDYFDEAAQRANIDFAIEENYEDAFSRFDEPEDRYLDSAYEDRYYEPELDWDIY